MPVPGEKSRLIVLRSMRHPFIPKNTGEWGHFGWSGILRGAGVIFFAYIGFDAVSTAAQEAKNPQKHMPIGILGSLSISTFSNLSVSLRLEWRRMFTLGKFPINGLPGIKSFN